MNDLKIIANYREFKAALDTELYNQAEGFVRVGYLLKQAQNTEILQESGYKSVVDFAKAEYGLSKDQVSRYIRINDNYSEGGNSDTLRVQFRGFGYSKLAEMLTLPSELAETLDPSLTKTEIKAIKDEIEEENKKSDIEVLMEDKDSVQEEIKSNLAKALYQYGKENPEKYVELWHAVMCTVYDGTENPVIEKILDAIAPTGIAVIMVRVQGIGRLVVSIKGKDNPVELVNVRSNEKETYTWDEMITAIETISECQDAKESWQQMYGELFPEKKEEVAPVQPKTEQKAEKTKSEQHKKESVLQISTPKKKEEEKKVDNSPKTEEKCAEPEEQIPGQAVITDYPEVLPENAEQEESQKEELPKVEGEIVTEKLEEQPEANSLNSEVLRQIDIVKGTFEGGEYNWTIKAAEKIIELVKQIQERENEQTNEGTAV